MEWIPQAPNLPVIAARSPTRTAAPTAATAGDIRINLLDIELLTIKVRLLISSADKARELGIDWWSRDPHLSGPGKGDDAGCRST